jgi:hypothetical protein
MPGVPNLIPPLASAPRAPGGPAAVDTGAPPRLAAPRVAEPARSGRRSRDTEGLTPRPTDFIDRHDDRAGDTSHGDGNRDGNDASEHDNDASEHDNDSDHGSDNGGDSDNGSDNGGNDDQTPRESRSPHHNGSRASSSDLLDAVLAAIERAWSGRG